MARPSPSSSSFSARRRWGIFFSVLVSIGAVIALVVMLNYLGARYFLRFNWSAKTTQKLSPRTLGLLKSITNDVKVVVYYDRENSDTPYPPVKALLNEYHLANPKISIEIVDYYRDSSAARRAQTDYLLSSADDKDQVIFVNHGRFFPVPSKMLWEYGQWHQASSDGKWGHDLKAFHGEEAFDAALINVINTNTFTACYLTDHGEHPLESPDVDGYYQFREILAQNNIMTAALSLASGGTVPTNCDLLVIAGPRGPIDPGQVDKIRQYLGKGGRLCVLFNNASGGAFQTGLEPLLAEYGVNAEPTLINDTPHTTVGGMTVVTRFNTKHPLSSPLEGYLLAVVSPRAISQGTVDQQDSDAPRVTELAFSGPNVALVRNGTPFPQKEGVPLMVAVEKANTKAGLAEHAPTRIVVVGDSYCLDNQLLTKAPDGAVNRDFAGFVANWLLNRPQLMAGIGSRPVVEYRLAITNAQLNRIHWIFLAAMPGGVLALGALVWLRRRR